MIELYERIIITVTSIEFNFGIGNIISKLINLFKNNLDLNSQ